MNMSGTCVQLIEIAFIVVEIYIYANPSLGSAWSVTQEATRGCGFFLFIVHKFISVRVPTLQIVS